MMLTHAPRSTPSKCYPAFLLKRINSSISFICLEGDFVGIIFYLVEMVIGMEQTSDVKHCLNDYGGSARAKREFVLPF